MIRNNTSNIEIGLAVAEPYDVAIKEYYSTGTDWQRFRHLIEIGVDAGDCVSVYVMATWYLYGNRDIGIKKDMRRAVRLLKQAALGSNRAMYDLAVLMYNGEGIRRTTKGAFRLFERSARNGCVAAMIAQAQCLYYGIGTPKNKRRAARIRANVDSLYRRMATMRKEPDPA